MTHFDPQEPHNKASVHLRILIQVLLPFAVQQVNVVSAQEGLEYSGKWLRQKNHILIGTQSSLAKGPQRS